MAFSVRSSLAWMFLSQGGLFVIQFGGSVVMARLLTPYEMGVFAVAYAIVGILSAIRSLGLGSFLVREPDLRPEIVATTFTINAILAATTAAAVWLLGIAGGAWLGDPGVHHVLLILALPPLLSVLEFVPVSRLERVGAFRVLAPINLAKVAASTAVTILLALCGFSYMSIAWGTLASAVLSVVCVNIAGRQFITFRPGFTDWRRITKFGVQILMVGVMGATASRVTDILMGRLIGLSALGLYTRASGLNGMLIENVHTVIARIVFVDFSERRRRSLPLRDSYLRIVAMVTALLWPAFAGLAILAGPVVRTIYGPAWTDAAPLLSLLCISSVIGISITMAGEIYLVSGKTVLLFQNELKRTIVGMILFALGCMFSQIWAAAARIAEAIVAVIIHQPEAGRMTETRASDFAPIYRQSAVLTIAATGPATILMVSNKWSENTPLVLLFATIVVGVAAWLIGLWLLRHPLWVELEGAGRNFFGRYVRGV